MSRVCACQAPPVSIIHTEMMTWLIATSLNSQMDSTIQEMGIYSDLLKLAEIESRRQLMADEIEKNPPVE